MSQPLYCVWPACTLACYIVSRCVMRKPGREGWNLLSACGFTQEHKIIRVSAASFRWIKGSNWYIHRFYLSTNDKLVCKWNSKSDHPLSSARVDIVLRLLTQGYVVVDIFYRGVCMYVDPSMGVNVVYTVYCKSCDDHQLCNTDTGSWICCWPTQQLSFFLAAVVIGTLRLYAEQKSLGDSNFQWILWTGIYPHMAYLYVQLLTIQCMLIHRKIKWI